MAYTLTQYQILVAAIAQGVKEVYYGDKRVVYRDLNEMLRIRDEMEAELGLNKGKPRRVFASFSKGIK